MKFGSLLLILLLSSTVAASTCALDGFNYACSCSRGKFDENGRIDPTCQTVGKAQSIACVTLNHPITAVKYYAGECPTMQNCIDKLQACASVFCPGSNDHDCNSKDCPYCYSQSDDCADKAAINCDVMCGDGKCDRDKGEDSSNCCQDCQCFSMNYYCGSDGKCKRACESSIFGDIDRACGNCLMLVVSLGLALISKRI